MTRRLVAPEHGTEAGTELISPLVAADSPPPLYAGVGDTCPGAGGGGGGGGRRPVTAVAVAARIVVAGSGAAPCNILKRNMLH